MHVISVRNAAEGLARGLHYIRKAGVLVETRNGPAYTAPEPVTTVYYHPKECIIDNPVRDANPFFHLIEAFWLLAGRNDTQMLDHYIKTFGQRFADDGILWGSYGKRWRSEFGDDQLKLLVNKLRADITTRQAVLQMWHAPLDLIGVHGDRPCNTQVYFRVRGGALDMTVTNRSNDIIMGLYGANAVQFSFLQRYVAESVGVLVGKYYHVSNDFHAYKDDLEKLEARGQYVTGRYCGVYVNKIVENYELFDKELDGLMDYIDTLNGNGHTDCPPFENRFLSDTVARAALAHYCYRRGEHSDAELIANTIGAPDWRVACVNWLQRRMKNDG